MQVCKCCQLIEERDKRRTMDFLDITSSLLYLKVTMNTVQFKIQLLKIELQ